MSVATPRPGPGTAAHASAAALPRLRGVAQVDLRPDPLTGAILCTLPTAALTTFLMPYGLTPPTPPTALFSRHAPGRRERHHPKPRYGRAAPCSCRGPCGAGRTRCSARRRRRPGLPRR
ncbi:hypothetical protein [Embleya sp. NBC_00896]|uniref:hypothetical protein n=1 Tax=Embleya sp. NBC_00896 TaxID=2975961 RepID=UPI002F91983D|nr:hypothetical protein OG928_38650 [Embleya sp. NBC_00896]